MRVKQHGFICILPDGRTTRFIALAREEQPEIVPCFLCGEPCLMLTMDEKEGVGYTVERPLHPTADDQQHCADCCTGCTIDRRKGVVL